MNWFDAEVHVARSRAAAERMAETYAQEQHIPTERELTRHWLAMLGALLVRWGRRLQEQDAAVVTEVSLPDGRL